MPQATSELQDKIRAEIENAIWEAVLGELQRCEDIALRPGKDVWFAAKHAITRLRAERSPAVSPEHLEGSTIADEPK